MFRGRAHLKRRLTETATPDPELIPVDDEVVELALAAKRRGRQVFVVTAASTSSHSEVAAFLPFVDGIISSDGAAELTGPQKAAVVSKNVHCAYDYVGASADDLGVWKSAREVIAVAPDRATRQAIQGLAKPTIIIEGKSRVRALVKAARLHQWVKIRTDLRTRRAERNDHHAEHRDRLCCGLRRARPRCARHLSRERPSRRRTRSPSLVQASSSDCRRRSTHRLGNHHRGGFDHCWSLGRRCGRSAVLVSLTIYLALTLAYSISLKRLPILDVTVLATLFTLRIAIGIAAAAVFASPWLLVFSMTLFASLSIAKRYTEIQRAASKGEENVPGRGYITADAPLVLGLGLSTGTTSVVILVLFLIFDALERDIYTNPHWLWLFPVIMFLWLGRIWLISQRGQLNDDPVVFAIKDRQSLILGALSAAVFGLALLGVPL